jgi:hypothetical protein
MNIKEDSLYILVEGEPDSPEAALFRALDINIQSIEVGGSSSFNIVAKLIYDKIKILEKKYGNTENLVHNKIPVLAIADRDFRKYSLDNDTKIEDGQLIRDRKVRLIYWERHEWENFLLDELDIICEILNDKSFLNRKDGKFFKNSTSNVNEEIINGFLLEYFQNRINIQTEFIECIRFRFRDLKRDYPHLSAPNYTDVRDLESLKQDWYISEIRRISTNYQTQFEQLSDFFDATLEEQEYNWKSWLDNPESLSLEDGKKYFRGKEAFKALVKYLSEKFEIGNLNDKKLKQLILESIRSRKESVLINQIKKLLSPYLEKEQESSV